MRAVIVLTLLALSGCNLIPPDLAESAYDPDGDGVPWPEDCDSGSAEIHPGAEEIWYDGIDQDCGGDDDFDQDGDGYVPDEYQGQVTQEIPTSGSLPGGDCWDEVAGPDGAELTGAEINPAADEIWYDGVDQDCDGASDFDADADGFDHSDYAGGDCDDDQPAINPGAAEVWYDGVDQDCDTNDCDADGDGLDADPDGLGFCDQVDCDDTDPDVGGTGSAEVWYDGVDQDCDGNDGDQDGDGYWVAEYDALVTAAGGTPLAVPVGAEGDCWDVPIVTGGLPSDFEALNGFEQVDADHVSPGALDGWYDGVDQDCAGDDDFDQDRDGSATDTLANRDGIIGTDCDDTNSAVSPGALEAWYDGVDQTCDGNDGDQDRDGYWDQDYDSRVTASGGTPLSIPSGYEGDCDDLDSSTWPGAPEYCDVVDSDCDGELEDDDALDTSTWYADVDGDGWGDTAAARIACLQPAGHVSDGTDCDDGDATVNPAATEICNGIEDDCDGLLDHLDPDVTDAVTWYPDVDADSYGDLADPGAPYCMGSEPAGWTVDASDCDDADAAQFPGASELCNGEDDDCDGTVDEDDALDVLTWYADADADGYGDPAAPELDCSAPLGHVAAELATDCDDADSTVHPGASEALADGVDSDCDGLELCYQDGDGDGFGSSGTMSSSDLSCSGSGVSTSSIDCDDSDAGVYPGAPDAVADGVDSDCDGLESCYQDSDGDGFGGTTTVSSSSADCSGAGESLLGSDCDDTLAATYPGATETVADGVDSDCDGRELCYYDADTDGWGSDTTISTSTLDCSAVGQVVATGDCDDGDASISPEATEVLADGVDQDCDGQELCYEDLDGDGFGGSGAVASADLDCSGAGEAWSSSDCDDGEAGSHPGATELEADGVDQDCDGLELCYQDIDGDGYGGGGTTTSSDLACAGAGLSPTRDDCDDGVAAVNPGAGELCNGVDDDCDGALDEADAVDASTWYPDIDGDGWGASGAAVVQCVQPSGTVSIGGDCDDGDVGINPGATETLADGVDQDCSGGDSCYADADGDGYGGVDTVESDDLDCVDSGEAITASDCDDADASTYPGAAEACDGADDDCDGVVDEDDAFDATLWYADADGDGVGDSSGAVSACAAPDGYVDSALGADCDDGSADIHPGATELCNGVDDDCDGAVDEDDAADAGTWYLDADADGYGLDGTTHDACSQPSGYAGLAGECDDTDAAVNPGDLEICSNFVDDDCDGLAVGCTPTGDILLDEADATLWGEDADDLAGYSVTWAGDVDGDGLDDLLVGARESATTGIYSGSAYLILGPLSGDSSLSGAHASFRGETYGDYAGCSVAGVGDVDGDGFDDLLLGASGNDAGGGNAGAAYLIHGPVTGELDLAVADVRLTGEDSGDQAGWSTSTAGDVNGDGLDDLLVGAFGNDLGGGNAGAAYLLLGPVTADLSLSASHARLLGEDTLDTAGSSVASAGDVDGDGLDDLLVGSPASDLGGSGSGVAYLVFGPVTGDLDLAGADARLIGDASDEAGRSVASAGDVDGDGLDDLLVGAPGCDVAGADAGAAYLLVRSVAGDVALSGADARLLGDSAGDEAGWSVAGAGDVDADGFDDLAVGALYDATTDTDAGAVYLSLGPLSGDHSLADASARLLGLAAGDAAGSSVAMGGDVNGDGYDDVLVGARENDSGGSDAGAVYLLLGGGL